MTPDRSRQLLLLAAPILLLTGVRLWIGSAVGLGDVEAYYWTWSRHLDAGYLDHGPAVAWLIRLGTTVAGDTPLGVRLPFILLSAATMALVGHAASRLARPGDPAGARAALWLVAMPMFLVAGGAANPDGPFVLLVAVVLVLLLEPPTLARLTLAGGVAGLACLAKFFGLLLALPLLVAARGASRPLLGAGTSLLAMATVALPQLIWNAASGWPSLRYHLVERHSEHGVGPSLANLGKLVGGQLAYVSPSMVACLVVAGLALWRARDPVSRRLLVLALALAGPAWMLILVVPGAEPHWPAAGYLPLLAVGAATLPRWRALRPRTTRWLTSGGALLSGLVAVGFHVHVLSDVGVRLMPASYEPRYDLANELIGWDVVGNEVARSARAQRRARPLLVGGCHYTVCSQLAYALRRRQELEVVCPSPRLDQYDLGPGGDGSSRRDVDLLYLRDWRFPFAASTLYRCETSREVSRIPIRRAGRLVRDFRLEVCRGFGGLKARRWPPARH